MGTNFGNVHVRTKDSGEVLAALRELTADRVQTKFDADTAYYSILNQANVLKNIYYIGQLMPGWVSILNDSFGWGEVESFGEQLSSYLNAPVMTISYFDDDVFEMNVYANGEQLTGQIWCSDGTQAVYELDDKLADVSIIVELLGSNHFAKIIEMIEFTDCEQAVEALQEIMQIPLWIQSDWFHETGDETFNTQYTKYDFNR